jgi:cytochrome c biogenesis protein CcdA
VAAIAFVGRNVTRPWRVLLAGLAYSLGRALMYVLIAAVVATSILSIPSVSLFLQERMNQVLGPLLVLMGVGMLGLVHVPALSSDWTQGVQQRAGRAGLAGACGLGMLFALSLCPVSAGLFFGGLLPLAIGANSRLVVPAAFGIGTGLPVIAFAFVLVAGAQWVGRVFHVLTGLERCARPVTAIAFILAGVYLSITHLGVSG